MTRFAAWVLSCCNAIHGGSPGIKSLPHLEGRTLRTPRASSDISGYFSCRLPVAYNQHKYHEPNGIKLSSNTLPYQCFACLSAWSGSPQASLGQHVTAWGSIHFDRVARRLPRARIPLTIDKKMAFD